MAILADIKTNLRISGSANDTEIQALIDACKLDLSEAGVLTVSDTDKLTAMAIQLYCKAHFGYDNPESERFMERYISLRNHLGLCLDYNSFKVTFTITAAGVAVKEAIITIDGEEDALTTNSLGLAYYYVRKAGDVEYTVAKSGYTTVDSSVYVSAATTVTVAL
jgi:hypothetical protein